MGTSAVVDNILAQLDEPINSAIEAALSGLYSSKSAAPVVTSFTGTVSQSPAITVQTSGTFTNNFDEYDDEYEGSAFLSNGGQFNGFSTSTGDSSAFTSNSFSEDSSSVFTSNSVSEDSSSFFSSNSFQSSGQSSKQTTPSSKPRLSPLKLPSNDKKPSSVPSETVLEVSD